MRIIKFSDNGPQFFLRCWPVVVLFFLLPRVALAASSITLQSEQSGLQAPDGEYEVNVSLSINQVDGTVYYLRGVFYKQGTTKYCGFTWNGSSWFNGPYSTNEGWKNLLPVTIESNLWSGKLKTRLDTDDSNCKDSGVYNFKVRRYNQSSGSSTFDDQQELSVTVSVISSTPTPSPTATPTHTPTPTITPTPSPPATSVAYPSGIYLSEFMADPESGGEEWVEIYNSNNSSVDLDDWKLDDQEGGSSPQDFTASLAPQGYKQVVLSSNKLNNSGDTVRLLRPDSQVADSASYTSSQKGIVWAKNDGGQWIETSIATPNEPNKFVPVGGHPHKENIGELKKLVLGSKIDLTAFVSVPFDVFSGEELYVADGSGGIKVSLSPAPSVKPNLGDEIRVSSTIEESHSEKYIKTDNLSILRTGLGYPDPLEISTGEVGELNEGKLVKISGLYDGSDGESFYIDDGTGRAKVYLKDSTGIIKLKMSSGDRIEVQGIVSQYGFLKDNSPNHRLMPRFQGDLRNLTEEDKLRGKVLGAATQLPATGYNSNYTYVVLVLSGLTGRLVLKFLK